MVNTKPVAGTSTTGLIWTDTDGDLVFTDKDDVDHTIGGRETLVVWTNGINDTILAGEVPDGYVTSFWYSAEPEDQLHTLYASNSVEFYLEPTFYDGGNTNRVFLHFLKAGKYLLKMKAAVNFNEDFYLGFAKDTELYEINDADFQLQITTMHKLVEAGFELQGTALIERFIEAEVGDMYTIAMVGQNGTNVSIDMGGSSGKVIVSALPID